MTTRDHHGCLPVQPLSGGDDKRRLCNSPDVDLDLAQVRAFVAVVDHGHFGRAAASLVLSQQALSKRVARLEAALGPLLVRERTGVVPTGAGERFLPAARQLLEVADRAVVDTRATSAPPLRIDVWGEAQTPARAMREVMLDHPTVVIELSMRRDLADAIAAVERHEIDLAFGDVRHLGRPLPHGLVTTPVLDDEIALLVNTSSSWADRATVDPAELSRIWFPFAGSSPELRRFAAEYAASIGAELVPIGANVGLGELVRRVAADPEVVTCVVRDWPLGGTSGVRVVPIAPPPHYTWFAVRRATAASHPALPLVLDALRNRAQAG
jgi:DNA-binding transcriptional LysR family regulator